MTVFRRLVPTRAEAVEAAAVMTITLVAVWAYRSSYGGVLFAVNAAIAAATAVVLLHVARKLAWPAWVTFVFALLAYVVLASLLALRHYGFGGIAPSPTSAYESLTSAAAAWKELITTTPPVGATGDLMVLPVFVGFTGALLMLVLSTTRVAALSVVPAFVVLGLGIVVGTPEPVSVVLHGAVLAVLVFAWLAYREHIRRPLLHAHGPDWRALAVGAVVLGGVAAAGWWLGPRLPGADARPREIWRQTVTPPFDPRTYPSPLQAYRSYVKAAYDESDVALPPEEVFTIEGVDPDTPVRLATMDAYDHMVWQVDANADDPSLRDSGSFERVGVEIAPDVVGEIREVTITIGEFYDGVWVPDVGEVISLRFSGSAGGPARDRELAESFRYNRETDTAATPLRLRPGDRYVMTVRLPHQLDSLAGQQIDTGLVARGGVRPVSEITGVLSSEILAIPDTAGQLERVKQLMREGAYSDGDLLAGQQRVRAGHNAGRLVEFAGDWPTQPFYGNAEQYAATYALFFREMGVPTRVVMGFLPDAERADEDGSIRVVRTDAEAWVEVPVAGRGWVAVFPTPDREQLQPLSANMQQPEPDYRTQAPPPPPVLDPEFDRPATAEGAERAVQDEPAGVAEQAPRRTDDTDRPGAVADFVRHPAVLIAGVVASPFLILALLAITVVVAKAVRRRRRRTRGAGHVRVANGWREVTDLAVDLGRPVPRA